MQDSKSTELSLRDTNLEGLQVQGRLCMGTLPGNIALALSRHFEGNFAMGSDRSMDWTDIKPINWPALRHGLDLDCLDQDCLENFWGKPFPIVPHIWIIDDQIEETSPLSIGLRTQGYGLTIFTKGEDALGCLPLYMPDLILLDVDLPAQNGFQVCKQFKRNKRFRCIPIIFISGLDQPEKKVKAFEVGAVDYVVKPFGLIELRSRINTQLKIHFLQRSLMVKNKNLQEEIKEKSHLEKQIENTLKQQQDSFAVIEKLRQTLDLSHIFSTTTEGVYKLLSCDRVLLYQFNPDRTGQVVSETLSNGYPKSPNLAPLESSYQSGEQERKLWEQDWISEETCVVKTWHEDAEIIQDSLSSASSHPPDHPWKRGLRYVCAPDIDKCGFSAAYLKLLEKLQARSYLIVPVFVGNQLWGLLCCYQNDRPRSWQDAEIQMVSHISSQLGVALHQSSLLNQMKEQSVALAQAKDCAELASQAKGQFIAHMSHELRTPLNSILGFTDLLAQENLLNHQVNILNNIQRSSQCLLDLINDTLDISKLEAGYMDLRPGECDLYYLLDNIVILFKHKIESKNLKFYLRIAPNVPQYIVNDEQKIRQILINLISNAVKFTTTGQIILEVKVQAQPTGQEGNHHLIFTVTDTGTGIEAQELDLLFQPFQQTKSGRMIMEGTGLGLAITAQLVKVLSGTIAVDSVVNQGSTFCVEIPIQALPFPSPFGMDSDVSVDQCVEPLETCKIFAVAQHRLADLLSQLNLPTQVRQWLQQCNQFRVLQWLEDYFSIAPLELQPILEMFQDLVYNFQFETIVQALEELP